jgi:hypothetical protein
MAMDTSPRTYRFLPSDVLMSGYRVVGKVMAGNTGVLGMLNDTTRSTLEVHDARLARIHMPTKLVDHFEVVRMAKSRVHAMCMARREDLGPQALVRGGFANITEYPARITTEVFEIEGVMEIAGRFDFAALMIEGTREFIPVFNATVTAILLPNLRVESPAILINRRQVDLIALTGQRANKAEK